MGEEKAMTREQLRVLLSKKDAVAFCNICAGAFWHMQHRAYEEVWEAYEAAVELARGKSELSVDQLSKEDAAGIHKEVR